MAFCRSRKVGHARKLFGEMQHDNVLPDPCTYHILIDGLCKNGCVLEAVDLFHNLKNCKFDLSVEIVSCLINGFV